MRLDATDLLNICVPYTFTEYPKRSFFYLLERLNV